MELFRLFGTIAINNQEANDAINETTDTAEKSHPRISTAFEKIGSAAVKVGSVIATGLAAGTAAIGSIVKDAVGNYAEYEQLVGGVETLFKDSGAAVLEYASKAYTTAGLSANEYMETVTSFSASLLQGLGGDTDKAAEIANRAITDMSDNANKMGTDMSLIQNAYQGFAKQNYTMLDNLKLGYGGTQSEMARLINESGVLGDSMEVTAETVNSVSFDKIIEAIGVVQDRMGITGTTAKEASTTIQGSFSSLKAAWANFLTGMADDTQDFDALLGGLVDSVITVGDNLIPRIQLLLPRLVDGLNQLISTLLPYVPGIIESVLPGLISGAVALLNGLIASLPSILQILIEQLPFIMTQISAGLVQTFPLLLQTVKDLFAQIWDYIAVELLGTEADFASSMGKMQEFFEKAWAVVQVIWDTIGQPIFDMIQDAVDIARNTFAQYMPEIKEFVSQCFTDIQTFWNNNLKPCLDAIGNFIETVLAPIFKEVFETRIKGAIDRTFKFIKSLWNDTLKPVFTGITDFLTGVFTGNWKKAWEGVKSILTGIVNGMINGVEFMINGAINGLNGLIAGLNKAINLAGSLLGLDVSIPTIPLLNLPRLEEGGILEKGQVGLLEGNGAEAVVPLDQNRAWISAVAKDMNTAVGGAETTQVLEKILEALQTMDDGMTEKLMDAFASMKFDINNREFARMVKAV